MFEWNFRISFGQCKSGRELSGMFLRLLTLIFEYIFALTVVLQSAVIVAEASTPSISDVGIDYEVMTNSCWSSNECLIAANLYSNSGNILPITVNCSVSENLYDDTISSIVRRRYENITSVTLDGCGMALNANTFGFEYIPNCNKVTTLNLKNFHFDEIYEIICGSGITLENLRFERNEFTRLSAASISNLASLKFLKLTKNNLRHMHPNALDRLQALKEITVIDELNLQLRYGKMFENLLRLEKLHISGIDSLSSEILNHLPVNLDNLFINRAMFDNKTIKVLAPPTLKNLTLVNCGLTSATIRGHEMITHLNLSANSLSQLSLENCTHLRLLDLSVNNLTSLPLHQFEQLHHLDNVYLQKNKLKYFSMLIFSNTLSHLKAIDLRRNDLKYIDDVTELLVFNINLRILIDGNPWNCLWLVNISYNFPEQYQVFRYEKFISKINVNGLECLTYPAENGLLYTLRNERKNSAKNFTTVYGSQRESRRNQKAEALVIVFMLPVGIAFLFVLLYLWINCQKVFHLSFYRSLPLVRSSAERFDIVRQLPLSNAANITNQGYEIPMTGCNCTGQGNKISCKLNVTYEDTTPLQNATKVYEEIIEYNNSTTGNCFYDHLNRD